VVRASGCGNTAGAASSFDALIVSNIRPLVYSFDKLFLYFLRVPHYNKARQTRHPREGIATMQTVVKIGDNVRHWRTLRTLTQVQLAQRAGISPAALVRIERNQADPHVSTIRRLSDALEVSPEQLILGE
jgi:DNA-binding XRE family transcriptional regulator